MSIFGRIKDAIFGSAAAKEASTAPSAGAAPAQGAAATPPSSGATTTSAQTATAASPAATAAPMSQVDVEAVLTNLAAQKGQKLDWRKSIVDLMKLLDLDSSLAARKELATGAELHRRHLRLGGDERLAAQAGHEQARGERRQGAGRSQDVGRQWMKLASTFVVRPPHGCPSSR